jgi:phosphoglycolate phosphatase-like HAD superfamily hydrolase
MGVEGSRSVMVGDSHNDVLAGKALGMRTVAVPVYFTRMDALEAARPDVIIKTLADLPEALGSLR